ncbi:GNAT family N-acetyltransferase [Paenibacillus tengchongensis]|uniref:GNAT family N-acetyltransferase n=1 Tax=Paenibacillus tengchongensis TaxID=2608684 RepID=UPI001FEBD233|nr:GNAT family N-acetyltransferase [Paenibacillus tengchongensis]
MSRVRAPESPSWKERQRCRSFAVWRVCCNIAGFAEIIERDTDHPRNICLIAEVDGRIVGYSRCEGNDLERFKHKVQFGVGVMKQYWGFGIGKNLLQASISWADANSITKSF